MAQNHQAESAFRGHCAAFCRQYPDVPRLRRIAAVGVFDADILDQPPDFVESGVSGVDSVRFTHLTRYLLASGFAVDPDFTVDQYNFRNRADFLESDRPYDLLFVSYIPAYMLPGLESCMATFNRETGWDEAARGPMGHVLSPRHSPDGWLRQARQAGVVLVASYGGASEVGTHFFAASYPFAKTPSYQRLSNTPNIECYRNVQPQLEDGNDIPCHGWFGFCADKAYLSGIAPALSDTTHLGRQALKAAQAARGPALSQALRFG